MKFLQKKRNYGQLLPRGYGIAWEEWHSRVVVCYPVPLNVVVAIFRGVWIWLKHGYRVVPIEPRDAFYQGMQEGIKQAKADTFMDL